ncbi:uncharacterized protein BO80DRAFT_366425, partial [Aspergillus ibericus CBS 121593]
SDAVFIDNINRKSTEIYICKLYNSPIDWLVKKQKAVTLFTIKAELLVLIQASK